MADRNALIRGFLRRQQAGRGKRLPGPPQFPSPHAQATTRPGKLSGGTRITEDDPRWNPRTMGNRRGGVLGPSKPRGPVLGRSKRY